MNVDTNQARRLALKTGVFLALSFGFALPGSLSARANDNISNFQSLSSKLGVEIATGGVDSPVRTSHGEITSIQPDSESLERYEPLLCSEFAIYSPKLLARAGLKRIALCQQLAFAGQLRNAIPDFVGGTLYLEAKRGQHNARYLRRVMHHDFFHMIDYRDDGKLYEDAAWSEHNPKGFQYGNGGQFAQDRADTSVLSDQYPGFLNHYSTTGVEEDKAEIYAWMIVESDQMDRLRGDSILAAKIERMKQLMLHFSDDADSRFWEAAKLVER